MCLFCNFCEEGGRKSAKEGILKKGVPNYNSESLPNLIQLKARQNSREQAWRLGLTWPKLLTKTKRAKAWAAHLGSRGARAGNWGAVKPTPNPAPSGSCAVIHKAGWLSACNITIQNRSADDTTVQGALSYLKQQEDSKADDSQSPSNPILNSVNPRHFNRNSSDHGSRCNCECLDSAPQR